MALKAPTDPGASYRRPCLAKSLILPPDSLLNAHVACKPGFPLRPTTEATLRPHRAAHTGRVAEGGSPCLVPTPHLVFLTHHPSTYPSGLLTTSIRPALNRSEQRYRLCPVPNSARKQSRLILFASKSRAYPGLHSDPCSQITDPHSQPPPRIWLSSSELALSRHRHKQTLLPLCGHRQYCTHSTQTLPRDDGGRRVCQGVKACLPHLATV